jgi:hypothetical protein
MNLPLIAASYWEQSDEELARESIAADEAWGLLEQSPEPPPAGPGTLLTFFAGTPFHRSDVAFERIPQVFKQPIFDYDEP